MLAISAVLPRTTPSTPPGRTAPTRVLPSPQEAVVKIWTNAALAAVQTSLRQQNRPMIQATERALLEQLREDGLLLDAENKVLPKDGAADATELMRDWD